MTDTDRPASAGVFVVRDPDVCAALEQLLAPHRTDTAPAAPAGDGSARVAALMADAEARAAELTGDSAFVLPVGAPIEQILDHVHRDGQALSLQDLADARDSRDEAIEHSRTVEAALARAERDLDDTTAQLKDALAKITGLQSDVATAGRDRELADGELNKLRQTIADLHDGLKKARTAPPPPRATGSRIADRKAFADLADRIDNQARGQSKDISTGMRIAARGLRGEIATVYGDPAKAAS